MTMTTSSTRIPDDVAGTRAGTNAAAIALFNDVWNDDDEWELFIKITVNVFLHTNILVAADAVVTADPLTTTYTQRNQQLLPTQSS